MSTRPHSAYYSAGLVFVIFLSALIAGGGCGSDSPVVEPKDNGGQPPPPPTSPPDSVLVTVRLASWDNLTGFGPVEQLPITVDEIRFELSAPDMPTQVRIVIPAQPVIEEDFTIKSGAARRIEVQALDAFNTLLYRSTKFINAVDSVLSTAVSMVSATDVTPPVYGGLSDAAAISDTYVLLSWQSATDGSVPDSRVSYLIFMSTVSGSFDYASPYQTSPAGETSRLVTDLDAGTTYYFVVRAMDRAGNIDNNTAQQSVTTSPVGGGLYVDVDAGSDLPACGTSSSPCKTITYALARTAGGEPIHVAKGTYNAASGETFPLQLKPGTALLGTGYWWMGVKVIKETFIEGPTPTILGADGASIISCYVKPTAYGSTLRTIDDDGHPITVFHCTVDGALFPGVYGVTFYSASSLIDCRIENFTQSAVGAWGSGGALIRGNVILNNQGGVVVGASNTTVNGCVIENITSVGLNVAQIDLTTSDVSIYLNAIRNCGGNGMQLENVTDIEVQHNAISHSGGYGIAVNRQEATHTVNIKSNSITHGSSAAIWLTGGGANINGNSFVCNVAGVLVRSDKVIDLRWNAWENDPPTISPGRGPVDPWCDGFYDICYERDYALTPEPLYQPDHGKGSCIIGIVPKAPPAR